MATIATETQVKDQLKAWVDLLETERSAAATTFVTDSNAIKAALVAGTNQSAQSELVTRARQAFNAFYGIAATAFGLLFAEYSRSLDKRFESNEQAFANVFRNYAENAKRVKSRGFQFGAASAGASNVGNGTIARCNIDEWGFTIENTRADVRTARCTADATSTAKKHQELWQLEGQRIGDLLEELGSGQLAENIASLSALDSGSFGVNNPSFSQATNGATASPTSSDVPGWTFRDTLTGSALTVNTTNFELVTGSANTEYYRGFDGDTTPLALRCKVDNFCIFQDLQANGGSFLRGVPYYFHVAICKRNNADGIVRFRITNAAGTAGVYVEVDLSTLANGTWTLLKIGLGSSGKDNWYRNFGSSGVVLAIDRRNGTTGEVDLDDVTVGPMTFFDGGYYAFVGGPTPFEIEDTFTITDLEHATAKNQKWMFRGPGVYLPSCPASPTAAPTAALAGAGAGNVDNGAHTYTKVWVDQNGIESGESATVAVTVVDKTANGRVTVGRNEVSPGSFAVYWRIYRSKAGTVTPRYKVADVPVATASYEDNIADASLPTTTPANAAGVTLDDPA